MTTLICAAAIWNFLAAHLYECGPGLNLQLATPEAPAGRERIGDVIHFPVTGNAGQLQCANDKLAWATAWEAAHR